MQILEAKIPTRGCSMSYANQVHDLPSPSMMWTRPVRTIWHECFSFGSSVLDLATFVYMSLSYLSTPGILTVNDQLHAASEAFVPSEPDTYTYYICESGEKGDVRGPAPYTSFNSSYKPRNLDTTRETDSRSAWPFRCIVISDLLPISVLFSYYLTSNSH